MKIKLAITFLFLSLSCFTNAVFACGNENGTPCTVFQRVPSCDRGLNEDFGLHKCVKPRAPAPAPVIVPPAVITQILTPPTLNCGTANQRPCNVTERIPSCDNGLKEDFGIHKCVSPAAISCGDRGQRPCLITERVPSCNSGLVEDFKVNKCLYYNESSGREFELFAQQFMRDNQSVIDALVEFSLALTNDQSGNYFSSGSFQRDLDQQNFANIDNQLGIAGLRQRLGALQGSFIPAAITIGIVADGGVGIGGNIEHGVAINLSSDGALAELYRTFGVSMGLITGGSGSVVVSLWKDNPQNIVGEARGLSFGAGKVVNPATGISVGGGVGLWFKPLEEFPGAIGFDYRKFIGVSVSVGVGASVLPVDLRGTSALTQRWNNQQWIADNCGAPNIRPCHVVERIPSCNGSLREDFILHKCVN